MIPTADTQRVWRLTFWVLAACLFVIMPLLSLQHGQSGDEWSLILYGNDIYDYFFNGSKKALDYDVLQWKQVEGLHLYGGLYDFTVTLLHRSLFSNVDELTFRHIINSLIGASLFLFTGLLGKELGRSWKAGVIALVFIALSPRLFGESMNNPKDIPFAFANVFFLYYLVRFLRAYPEKRWKYTFMLGLGFGLAMGFRIGGIILLPYYVLFTAAYYFFNSDFKSRVSSDLSNHVKKLGISLVVLAAIGYAIGIATWPWALQEPLSRPLEALSAMTNRQIYLPLLFEGEMIGNDETPWYYTFKWIFISNPVIILLGFLAALALLPKLARRYGRFEVFLVLFTLFFPWLYAVYKHSVVYDTWRHFFFIYPSLALLSALFFYWLLETYWVRPAVRYAVLTVILAGLALPFAHMVRNSPNEYVYFNEFAGGPAGAVAVYDFDYYQNSGKQNADWIKQQAQQGAGKIKVRSNLSGIEKYFVADTAKYDAQYMRYEVRDTADWDYYITYSRYQPVEQLEAGQWPPKTAVHIVRVDGVPISAVLHRPSKEGVLGFRALSLQQYPEATAHFAAYLKADPTNEMILPIYGQLLAQQGRIPEAIDVLTRAKQADPSNQQLDAALQSLQAASRSPMSNP
jgi:tetratricopeptide (TPR) repeat protein